MMFATYDYWGYYNITFLGGEVKDAARTVPRAILISIALVAALYLAMNISVLAVLPWQGMVGARSDATSARARGHLHVHGGGVRAADGPALGKLAAALVMVTAFASVFSLLLGYSRIPYAAARDGNYFRIFGRLHPKGFPHVSLLTLGAAAICFCFFSLADVIAALVVLRILLQFLMQHIGVIYLRRTQPNSAPLPHLALPAAAAAGHRRIHLHPPRPRQLPARTPRARPWSLPWGRASTSPGGMLRRADTLPAGKSAPASLHPI